MGTTCMNTLTMWIVFIGIVLGLLALDLGYFNKKDHVIGFKESLWMTAFYVFIACLFGLWIGHLKGLQGFSEYITGFLVEKSLSLDNIFVISLIFTTLSIPAKYQHRVLFWGILGVIVLRAIMIALGAHIIAKFHWVLYLFAAFLMFTGIKMFFVSTKEIKMSDNVLLKWLQKHLNVTEQLHAQHFFVYQSDPKTQSKKWFVTPIFIALVMIECIDLVFAVDSIPAIFAITQDAYIVYTSNIFAILGLRSLYFAIASLINNFYYLKYALALVLVFIGSKIFLIDALKMTKFPPMLSLIVTLSLLTGGIIISLIKKPKNINKK